MKENKKELDIALNNVLDILEDRLIRNFSKIVVSFEKGSVMSEHAAVRVHSKCAYLTAALSSALDAYGQDKG
eukprot:5198210-Ditylum_brightwellii.AAC.1